jgi:hypothetical protein
MRRIAPILVSAIFVVAATVGGGAFHATVSWCC